jgi:hypothetical protein
MNKDENAPDVDVDQIADDDDDEAADRRVPGQQRRVYSRRKESGRWRDTKVAPWHVRLRCALFGHRIDTNVFDVQLCDRCRGFRQRTS